MKWKRRMQRPDWLRFASAAVWDALPLSPGNKLSTSIPRSLPTATDCAANASFASMISKSSILRPVFLRFASAAVWDALPLSPGNKRKSKKNPVSRLLQSAYWSVFEKTGKTEKKGRSSWKSHSRRPARNRLPQRQPEPGKFPVYGIHRSLSC